jgi:hypothetical protein
MGTEKTYRAQKLGIKVVWVGWFWRCLELWKRVGETDWLVIKETREGTNIGSNQDGHGEGKEKDTVGAGEVSSNEGKLLDINYAGEGKEEVIGDNVETEGDIAGEEQWDDAFQAELDAMMEGDGDSEIGDRDGDSAVDRSRCVMSLSSDTD